MSISLVAVNDDSCKLVERAMGTTISSEVTIPVAKPTLIAAMKALLSDADKQHAESGNINVARRRDELRVEIGAMAIPLRWPDVFPIVLEAE